MDILVVGGGGREHAITKKLKESPLCGKLYCAPGNGGIAEIAECLPVVATDLDGIVRVAKENAVDLVFVAPDDPLALGLVNRLEAEGIRAFGPRAEAAVIEASKAFSKEFMKRHSIPTAAYETFDDRTCAAEYLASAKYPLVLKADGLALGKGVLICQNEDEAIGALDAMMTEKRFGAAGNTVVVEEFLTGKEFTLLAFTDGKAVRCMPASQDHKRAYDGDKGLNTGGMGAFAPTPTYTEEIVKETLENIVYPTLSGLSEENREFKGVIYFGLMATSDGVKVIEYNARFGDPETQVVLPLLQTDLVEIVNAVVDGTLADLTVEWADKSALTVVVASGGYPGNVVKGLPVEIGELSSEVVLYHSGTKLVDGALVTNGGRVFCLTAVSDSIADAREKVYSEIDKIQFQGARYRTDIGKLSAVKRLYVEKRPGFDSFTKKTAGDLKNVLGISTKLRTFIRYDTEGIDEKDLALAATSVFSEPPVDNVFTSLDGVSGKKLVVEYLDGQYDQRADSAAQCVQLLTSRARPRVKCATVYVFEDVSEEDFQRIAKYLVNPVDSKIGSDEMPDTLATGTPDGSAMRVEIDGFISLDADKTEEFYRGFGFAMSLRDLFFVQDYFRREKRNPTLTELKVVDTYWSDHCRHTTFLTELKSITVLDGGLQKDIEESLSLYRKTFAEVYDGRTDKYPCLMDVATLAVKYLKRKGHLKALDQSEEINACSVVVTVDVDGADEEWLVMFKNETHNHPAEIEPYGGAATCLGGAIRDPLSGRAYVYQAMRITGAGNPLEDYRDTLKGKLPQRVLTKTALAGFSGYGNQIGLATGTVHELYDDGYKAKRLETGYVIGAAPKKNVVRKCPKAGDKVLLVGGNTGRDGCGGATGSSKAHTEKSVAVCGAEVQKGNAPEERKLQRLFRNPEAAGLILRCNDFGAGGVSVAIGELAEGLDIRLDCVPKKYDGLTATELAISESQERMAVVVAAEDVGRFSELAADENLKCTLVAEVTDTARLRMFFGEEPIVDITREFLDTNGVKGEQSVEIEAGSCPFFGKIAEDTAAVLKNEGESAALLFELSKLCNCSQKGAGEVFDSTIGAATVLMPFGGKFQLTPTQIMASKPPVPGYTETVTCSSFGINTELLKRSPYLGAIYSVVTAVSKLVASGVPYRTIYLTLQEFFKKLGADSRRWGEPTAALLGAFDAQCNLRVGAIGGKDSMSGSFENLDVPPTLIAFAMGVTKQDKLVHNAFGSEGFLYRFAVPKTATGKPDYERLISTYREVQTLVLGGKALNCAVVETNLAVSLAKSALGNGVGISLQKPLFELLGNAVGDIVLVLRDRQDTAFGEYLGELNDSGVVSADGKKAADFEQMRNAFEKTLEVVFPTTAAALGEARNVSAERSVSSRAAHVVRPTVFLPVFPGTNCEYDTAKAFECAGAKTEIFVVKNRTAAEIEASIERMTKLIDNAQIIAFPGGFSGGDEPDGSGKFIATAFRNPKLREAVERLLYERDGLALGICNGFQALIKLGLLPFGKIAPQAADSATLTYNNIARHVSTMARVRVASTASPWLSAFSVGDVFNVPVSHGEGKFVCDEKTLEKLVEGEQIATQYVDFWDCATMASPFNPNGSVEAVEGIVSPDGRIFGKMGHAERWQRGLYQNLGGNADMDIFSSGVKYFG